MTYEFKIDQLTADGHVEGWARGADRRRPCGVEISHDGEGLVACLADIFRRDLLVAGDSHGFHGFRGRLRRNLPPGQYEVKIGDPFGPVEAIRTTVHIATPIRPTRDVSIAELLVTERAWTDADVLDNLSVFRLDANLQAMGVRRFVDASFYFALSRWADDAGLDRYQRALTSREITPAEFLRILLLSFERTQNNGTPLPGPYSYKFPFELSL